MHLPLCWWVATYGSQEVHPAHIPSFPLTSHNIPVPFSSSSNPYYCSQTSSPSPLYPSDKPSVRIHLAEAAWFSPRYLTLKTTLRILLFHLIIWWRSPHFLLFFPSSGTFVLIFTYPEASISFTHLIYPLAFWHQENGRKTVKKSHCLCCAKKIPKHPSHKTPIQQAKQPKPSENMGSSTMSKDTEEKKWTGKK